MVDVARYTQEYLYSGCRTLFVSDIPFLSYGLAALCIIIAGVLAFKKTDNWGWFLIVGVLLVPAAATIKSLTT